MKSAEFQALLLEVHQKMVGLTATKGAEYKMAEDNQFANFEKGAKELGMTREQVLMVYLSKHLSSITLFVKEEATGVQRKRSEPMAGRIDDAILYLILLRGMISGHPGHWLIEERPIYSQACRANLPRDPLAGTHGSRAVYEAEGFKFNDSAIPDLGPTDPVPDDYRGHLAAAYRAGWNDRNHIRIVPPADTDELARARAPSAVPDVPRYLYSGPDRSVSHDIRDLSAAVHDWASSTFGPNRETKAWKKMFEELGEVIKDPDDPMEWGDLFILLLDLAMIHKINVASSIAMKMEVNFDRKWREVHGVMCHDK